jgi:hypothetical protein
MEVRRETPVRRLALVMLPILLLCACSPQEGGGGSHRWRSPVVTYYINSGANEPSEKAIRQVFDEWGSHTHFQFVYGGRNQSGLHRDGKSTVSFERKWPLTGVPQDAVSFCKLWYDQKGDIVEADIIFHIQIVNFSTRSNRLPKTYCLEGVLSHEIGHLIGLGNINSADSLMKPASPPAESWNDGRIDAETLAAYKTLYGKDAR